MTGLDPSLLPPVWEMKLELLAFWIGLPCLALLVGFSMAYTAGICVDWYRSKVG